MKIFSKPEPGKIPKHVAIIMDGNGRWARKRGMPRTYGHREGAETLRRMVKDATELGVEFLTVYAFSTENWSRPDDEVSTLMNMIPEYLTKYADHFIKNNIKVKVIGDISFLAADVRTGVEDLISRTAGNSGLKFIIAWNYGGRKEIVRAVKLIAQRVKEGKLSLDEIDESTLSANLYTAGVPDPDLVIRTSGELRTSNFLIWQSAYAEYYVTDVLWPDFSRNEFLKALDSYAKRNRRYGGVKT